MTPTLLPHDYVEIGGGGGVGGGRSLLSCRVASTKTNENNYGRVFFSATTNNFNRI